MILRSFLPIAALVLASCSEGRSVANAKPTAAARPLLQAASIGPEGFATITDAPPAPFTPAEPGAPPPLTAEQVAGNAQFARAGRFQNQVMGEVQALAETLRAREKGNFVDLYFDNEGDPRVVFRFLRDPQATLARYTRHPRFFAEQTRFSDEEVRAALDFMLETFREDRVILGGGSGNRQNRAVVELGITEAEFQALVARKGVTIPESVELVFVTKSPASSVNTPLVPEIAPLIRIFARDNRPTGAVNAIESRAKIVLRDGCFRIAGGDHDGASVLFPLGAQLFVDPQGYLAYGSGASPGYARVGEQVVFGGSIGAVTVPELVAPIQKACGAAAVVKVNSLKSAAAEEAQNAVSRNASELRFLRENYGLSEADARKAVEACKARSGGVVCLSTPPPPPPRDGLKCPAGTRPTHGICRTPEGYARPIPEWITKLLAQ